MKIFSRGVLSTPRLRKVQLAEGEEDGDINTMIQEFHKRIGK